MAALLIADDRLTLDEIFAEIDNGQAIRDEMSREEYHIFLAQADALGHAASVLTLED